MTRLSRITSDSTALLTPDTTEDVSAALPVTQIELVEAREQLEQQKLARDRRYLRASVAGRIIEMKHSGAGPVVGAGEVLFEIVPDQEGVIIEATVRPSDIDAVREGMVARVVLSAVALQNHRSTSGTVVHVSPDIFIDQSTSQSFYDVQIAVDEREIMSDIPDVEILIGMPAEVYILSGERTLLQYLMGPISQLMERGLRE